MKWEYTNFPNGLESWRVVRSGDEEYVIDHDGGSKNRSGYTACRYYWTENRLGIRSTFLGQFGSLREAKQVAELAIVEKELSL